MTLHCDKCKKEVHFINRAGLCDDCQKENDLRHHKYLAEEGARKRKKTVIGVKHNLSDAFGSQYYDQEIHINCEPNDIYVNGKRWNEDYKDLYQTVVDLCHQILIDGSNLNNDGDYGENDWYETLEATSCKILDALGE